MIANIKKLEKYCTDYKNIENYDEAIKSPLIYDLHHRLEISEMQTRSDLKFLHLYYHRPPEELIFLERGEHIRLHNANRSEETKQKLSENHRGDKNPMFGKHPSAETRKKLSEAKKGRHWHLENSKRIYTD